MKEIKTTRNSIRVDALVDMQFWMLQFNIFLGGVGPVLDTCHVYIWYLTILVPKNTTSKQDFGIMSVAIL